MSYDLHVEGTFPVRYLDNDNFTSNINRLLRPSKWVGLTLRHLDGMPVREAATVLFEVSEEWRRDPDRFREFEVKDWGNLEQCLGFLHGLCHELMFCYPGKAILRVS